MSVNRISDFNISQRELLSGIFGNTRNSEYFIDKDLCKYNISKSLFMYLKGEGYKVVFYNPTNNIGFYSYEEEDLALFSGFSRESTIRTSNSNESGDGLQASDKYVRKGDRTSYVPKFNTPFGKIEPRFGSGNKKEPNCTSDKTQITTQDASSQKQSVRNIKCHYPQIYFHYAGMNSFFKRQSSTDVFDEVFGYSDNNPNDRMAVIFEYPENICPPKPDQIENRFGELSKVYGEENRQMKMIILFGFQTSGQLAAAYDREHGKKEMGSGVFFRDSFGTILGVSSSNKQNDADREIYMEIFERNMFCIDLPQEDEIENWLIRKRICDDVRCTLSPKPFESLKRGIAMGNFKLPNKEGILEFAKMNERKIVKLNRPDLNIEQLINTVSADDAEKQLRNLDGMEDVVSQIESLKNLIIINRRQKEETGHGLPVYPHMVFMGNPGTGKTTVAHLVAQWFREENVLSKGTFVSAKVADLVGQYIGETRIKAQALCERARGGLLFIDEAYGLREKKNKEGVSYEAEAVEILIQYMTKPDFMVILAGYKDEMEDLLNNSNDGLRSRISDDGIIMFRDYNPNTLVKILERNLTHPKTEQFSDAIRVLVEVMYDQRNLRKWGNARAMEQLAASIYKDFYKKNGTILDVCHIPEKYKKMINTEQKTEREILQGLNELIGLKNVKTEITNIYYKMRRDRRRMKAGQPVKEEDLVFVFTGSPGTGKTTVARLLGGILHDLGLLSSSDYLEKGSEDIIDGGIEKNVEDLFMDSVGKTLFIDEAYGIYERGGKSAITQIVRLLTDPRYKGKMALIMAGYPTKMNQLLSDNPGMKRKVKHIIQFDDYSNEDLWQILQLNMRRFQRHFSDEEQCHQLALAWFDQQPRTEDFGNASVSENLLDLLDENKDQRLRAAHIDDLDSLNEYSPEDFPNVDLSIPNTNKGPVTIKLSSNPFFEDGYNYDNYRKATGLIKLDNGNKGTGSGFLISPDGYIITCAHCTEANKISFVKDDDKKEFEADVIYKNDLIDIAILKIDANDMPYLSISDSVRPLKVGEEIVIMAYPSGTEISDNVSAFEGKVSNFINANKTYITDAVAAPGSSGGALIAKKDGKVYGVLQGGYKEILEVDINASFDIRNLFKQNDLVIEFN